MNYKLIIFGFCFIKTSFLICQNKLIIKKTLPEKNCCDSLAFFSYDIDYRFGDTVFYSKLIKKPITFGVQFLNRNKNASATIHSFEVLINKEKYNYYLQGNILDLKGYKGLENGGSFTIQNLKVTCTNDQKTKIEKTLNLKKYIVLPSKTIEE